MNKFNSGNGVVVCDICGKIIRTGHSENGIDICPECQLTPQVVDNFERLADQLIFDDENTFYWVQIIKRRKDNPGMHGDYISYGDYWIYSSEQLLNLKEELIKISHTHNARVVLWINRRDAKEITFESMGMALEYYRSKQFSATHTLIQHVVGKHRKKCDSNGETIRQLYIVDIDQRDQEYLHKVILLILNCIDKNNKTFKITEIVPTLHGYHLLCTGFNLDKFQQDVKITGLEKIDIQKDNPTLLYFNPK